MTEEMRQVAELRKQLEGSIVAELPDRLSRLIDEAAVAASSRSYGSARAYAALVIHLANPWRAKHNRPPVDHSTTTNIIYAGGPSAATTLKTFVGRV